MRLTHIKLNNFRTFHGEHEIALSPITVLYGINDAGKSNLIAAIKQLTQLSIKDAFPGEKSVSISLSFSVSELDHDGPVGQECYFSTLYSQMRDDFHSYLLKFPHLENLRKNFQSVLQDVKSISSYSIEHSIELIEIPKEQEGDTSAPSDESTSLAPLRRLKIYVNNSLFLALGFFDDSSFIYNIDACGPHEGLDPNFFHPLFRSLGLDFATANIFLSMDGYPRSGTAVFFNDAYERSQTTATKEEVETILSVVINYKQGSLSSMQVAALHIATYLCVKVSKIIKSWTDSFLLRFFSIPNPRIYDTQSFTYSIQETQLKSVNLTDLKMSAVDGELSLEILADPTKSVWQSLAEHVSDKPNRILDSLNDWLLNRFHIPNRLDFKKLYTLALDSDEKREAFNEAKLSPSLLEENVSVKAITQNHYTGNTEPLSESTSCMMELAPIIYYSMTMPTFSVEQPELNLHPDKHHLLADLFIFEGLYSTPTAIVNDRKEETLTIHTQDLDGSEKGRVYLPKSEKKKSFMLIETHSEKLCTGLTDRVKEGFAQAEDIAIYEITNKLGKSSINKKS